MTTMSITFNDKSLIPAIKQLLSRLPDVKNITVSQDKASEDFFTEEDYAKIKLGRKQIAEGKGKRCKTVEESLRHFDLL
ncbi:MAG: hypothetical protein LBQ31_03015 [Bacteroidales bacterium]|jgi:hypothetical protein|nr:hypothetical protein [Bacteroidales bacterium]